MYFRTSPSGEVMTTPTPPLPFSDDPLVCIVHNSAMPIELSSGMVNSAMKSANTWAFIVVQGLYSMLNWLSLTAHYTIRPTASGLFIAFLIGWSVMTRIKFCLKVRVQLPRSNDQSESNLLDAWVFRLCSLKGLVDVVYRALDSCFLSNQGCAYCYGRDS